MQKAKQEPVARRIDLSNCKLLSPYGRNAADDVNIGTKIGVIGKIGGIIKPEAR